MLSVEQQGTVLSAIHVSGYNTNLHRMPVWDDFNDLPYINCIVKEGLRWHPVYVS